jgi:hypothetical protein
MMMDASVLKELWFDLDSLELQISEAVLEVISRSCISIVIETFTDA